jgi:hypothetical protein
MMELSPASTAASQQLAHLPLRRVPTLLSYDRSECLPIPREFALQRCPFLSLVAQATNSMAPLR